MYYCIKSNILYYVFATLYIFIEPDQYRCVIRLSKVQRSSPYEYGSQTERAGNRE